MEVIEGRIDMEALKSGKYILLRVECDDNGSMIENTDIHAGDTVRINHIIMDGLSSKTEESFDFTIMAKVRTNENTTTTRHTRTTRFYLPTENFLPLCDNPHLVSFPFNVKSNMVSEMEEFFDNYVKSIEPNMDFISKETYINSFHNLTSLIVTIGGALSIIIGFIGIANFVNSVLTSIITRRKEFAILQSIGMTGKQLKHMLSYEGLYYAVGTILTSTILGIISSMVIVKGISNGIWFFTYHFVMYPMLVVYPFLLILTILLPIILYRQTIKVSIVERLL